MVGEHRNEANAQHYLYQDLNPDQWLLSYAGNVYSQTGEDGILAKISDILGIASGWCVEFGAGDGKHLSNTRNLIVNHGWSGVLIEADKNKCRQLRETYAGTPGVVTLREYVTYTGESSLDVILANTPLPQDFDLLSIDIDGNDYHIWDSLWGYQPKVVCIEHNPTIPNDVEFVQPRAMAVYQGSSALALRKLGKAKGYALVAQTRLNSIFVQEDYFESFGIQDNSLDRLWPKENKFLQVYVLYDGTLVLHGPTQLPWHGVSIRPDRLQVLPRPLRFLTYSREPMRRLAQRIYLWLYRRGMI